MVSCQFPLNEEQKREEKRGDTNSCNTVTKYFLTKKQENNKLLICLRNALKY